MTNPYYNFTDIAVPGAIVDAIKYNREMMIISETFDNFPPPIEFISGTINYGKQPTGQPVNTYDITITGVTPGAIYKPGNNVAFNITTPNTGDSQLSVSGNGYAQIFMGTAGTLIAGDFRQNGVYTAVFDGLRWRTLEMSTRYLWSSAGDRDLAQVRASAASASAAAALASQTAASGSAASALASQTAASGSAASALASQTAASGSAASALASQTAASGSAASALASQTAASGSAAAAANSASVTFNRATIAANSATSAANSATSAANSATSAANANDAAHEIMTDPDINIRLRDAILKVELPIYSAEFFADNIDPNVTFPGTSWVRLPEDVTIRMADSTGSNVLNTSGSDTVNVSQFTMRNHVHGTTDFVFDNADVTASMTERPGADVTTGASNSAQYTDRKLGGLYTSTAVIRNVSISSDGAHFHSLNVGDGVGQGGTRLKSGGSVTGSVNTSTSGSHNHTFSYLAHNHTFTIASHSHTVDVGEHNHDNIDVNEHSHTFRPPNHSHTSTNTCSSVGDGEPLTVLNSNIKLVAWYRTA